MSNPFAVNGVALVTGAANGIGRATALALADAGADLGLIDVEADALAAVLEEVRAKGRRVEARAADCTDAEALADAIQAVQTDLGDIEVLFNNVGQSARDRASRFLESDEEVWRFVLEVSLLTTMRASRLVAPAMVERSRGRIVSMSSESAFFGDVGLVDYSAAKMGVVGFTRALARELAPQGVNVNVVCPGAIRTRAHERLPAEVIDRIRDSVPLGFVGLPEDVANVVVFLASDASRYITGQSLLIDGGRWMI
ncbi:MAG: SDR family NAD(P)-dependent oxidoreductase [Alphaproteobacteria bacterium]